MKRKARSVYRVRAIWRDRQWVVGSADVDGLLVYAHRLDEVAPVARNTIARLYGVHGSTIDIAVQPVSLADPELQWMTERALVTQEHAKALAEEAAERTLHAVDELAQAGMDYDDARRLLGLTDNAPYDRRMGRYGIRTLDDDPWLRKDDEDDWHPVDPWGDRWPFDADDPSYPTRLLKALAEEVGGAAELAVLDDVPLAGEAFAWDGIAEDIRPLVADVLALCDEACVTFFANAELRTSARRLLGYLARRAPKVFRRRGSAAGAAGAVCWIVATANKLFDPDGPRQKDLAATLGISNASGRASTFLMAGGFTDDRWSTRVRLGSADYLVSEHRRRIIELRDAYAGSDDDLTRQVP